MVKEFIQIGNDQVRILRCPRQRYMRLRVLPDGKLRITCARHVTQADLRAFILESAKFILDGRQRIQDHHRAYPAKIYESGEPFLYFGERLPLQLIWSWSPKIRVEAQAGELEMIAPITSTVQERKQALFRHFKKLGKRQLEERARAHSLRMGLAYSSVTVRGQTSRWGSCTWDGKISLNWKLMSAPSDVIDYVIIHELAHLRHLDHSERFWNLVGSYFPDYKRAKKWLTDHEAEIAVQFQKNSKPD